MHFHVFPPGSHSRASDCGLWEMNRLFCKTSWPQTMFRLVEKGSHLKWRCIMIGKAHVSNALILLQSWGWGTYHLPIHSHSIACVTAGAFCDLSAWNETCCLSVKAKQTTCFHKPFHLYFLVPSMLRCLGGFETNSLDAKNVPPPTTIYDRIVCISNGFWPNPGLLSVAPIIGPMPAAQTTKCRLWWQKMPTKIVRQFKGATNNWRNWTCKKVFWGALLLR